MRQQLAIFLQGNGYQVETADDGSTALAACRLKQFDMVITDLNMQGMNGISFVGELRKIPSFATVPVFVLTTESAMEIMSKGKAAEATAWIVKPFRPDILIKGIQKVLGVAA